MKRRVIVISNTRANAKGYARKYLITEPILLATQDKVETATTTYYFFNPVENMRGYRVDYIYVDKICPLFVFDYVYPIVRGNSDNIELF